MDHQCATAAPYDGWVTFTIVDEQVVEFEVTNVARQLFGQFQVTKTVTGDGEGLVPDDAEVHLHLHPEWRRAAVGDRDAG